ncbi:hypothetical protein QL285_011559 [Trifolium repens]|nr:hypothetical protein QL285_011559 [Trifolium repens]
MLNLHSVPKKRHHNRRHENIRSGGMKQRSPPRKKNMRSHFSFLRNTVRFFSDDPISYSIHDHEPLFTIIILFIFCSLSVGYSNFMLGCIYSI